MDRMGDQSDRDDQPLGPPGSAASPAEATAERGSERQRLEALRRLANDQRLASSGVRTGALSPVLGRAQVSHTTGAQTLQQRWLVGLSAVLVGVVVVSVALAALASHAKLPQTALQSPVRPVEITPASDLINCPTDLAWSPNLRMIAVVGYAGACPSPDPVYGTGFQDVTSALYQGPLTHTGAGYVAVYDTHQGTHIAALSLDGAILQRLHAQALIPPTFAAWLGSAGMSPDQYLTINYTHVVWAASQQRLLITFTCFIPNGPPTSTTGGQTLLGHTVQGLESVDLAGQHTLVMLHVSTSVPAGADIWDLDSARVVASLPATAPFALQPPALSYSWGTGGALTAHAPVTASVPAPSTEPEAIGVPGDGSATSAVWQPGLIATAIGPQQAGEQSLSGVAAFAANTAALSPDGRYLATSIGMAALLVAGSSGSPGASASAPSPATLARYGWQSTPRLPVRDPGLLRALKLADQSGYTAHAGEALTNSARVAWRPDGKVIAVSISSPSHTVALYACATGKPLQILTASAVAAGGANATTSLLAWAPDGRQLAFYDVSTGTLTLWNDVSSST